MNSEAEQILNSHIYNNQVKATKLVGEILLKNSDNLCDNKLEELARYLTVISAVRKAVEDLDVCLQDKS